jgi:hypothetical protein
MGTEQVWFGIVPRCLAEERLLAASLAIKYSYTLLSRLAGRLRLSWPSWGPQAS